MSGLRLHDCNAAGEGGKREKERDIACKHLTLTISLCVCYNTIEKQPSSLINSNILLYSYIVISRHHAMMNND
jgi:hypothetical protein